MNPPTTIRVTADHIRRGKMGDIFGCPIALALCEQGGYEPGDLHVGGSQAIAPAGDQDVTADLPSEAVEFVYMFDGGDEVEPFEFEVEWRP